MIDQHDPPGYSQPSLPPAEPPKRWSVPLLSIGLAAVGALTLAAYAFLPHGERTAQAQPATAAVIAKVDALRDRFPAAAAERACTPDETRMPLVLHSAIGAASPANDTRLVMGATPTDAPITATKVAVLRTAAVTEPEASLGEPRAGRYEGDLVVFDAATNAVLCQTHVVAWSSSTITQPAVSQRLLHDDFTARIQSALSEAAARMHVALDL